MTPAGSVHLHGKVWLNETDVRTSTSPRSYSGRADSADDDVLQQRKYLSWITANGFSHWWFDVGGIRYDHPRVLGTIRAHVALGRKISGYSRKVDDRIAFVVDPESACYVSLKEKLTPELLNETQALLCRCGANVRTYGSFDLAKLSGHKVFVFPNLFAPSGGERAAVERLKKDGNVLVFLYAPGVYADKGIDIGAMEKLTGIRLARSAKPPALRVSIKAARGEFAGCDGVSYGPGRKIDPAFHSIDEKAQVLGRLPDGTAGLVVKDCGGWTSVYSAAPNLPPAFFRALARKAGVHVYLEADDLVWAARDVLAVSVNRKGRREVRLPAPRHVYDVYRKEKLGRAERFGVDFRRHGTRLFLLGDEPVGGREFKDISFPE
jgi:hypothetical protein